MKINQKLWEACRSGNLILVKSLLDDGASVNYVGPKGKLPSIIASEYGHMNVHNLCLNYETPNKELTQILFNNSIDYDDIEAVQYHIEQGADVNSGSGIL